ncbi:hypothetical protein VIBNISO65_1240004 [Vibrio nigripulchritudo SO65]|nr:hypothetical protein VIBNIAM115_1800003 [Vibrio nigripulchritudo AM115]CCN42473.1 hypothetical protein VIBNIFTn2_310003 [Vibrio nigripulchritudo FTn2]CCN63231.1 hypothetical protein VIBNIPon4_1180001 [Vibrio nigripulchritudo POn4]CCN75009.1 hypothetical protein VIBNISO65_1240004 [Vibrio nigripulchritudo SO65]
MIFSSSFLINEPSEIRLTQTKIIQELFGRLNIDRTNNIILSKTIYDFAHIVNFFIVCIPK